MENNFQIDFKNIPYEIYRIPGNPFLFKLPFEKGKLWIAKPQMKQIFGLPEVKLSKVLKDSLK
ncbi:MAG: hypothetical protein KDC84_16200, partial [Crocinitomicaceae bacterium]|nr:hypothetical protein [Crocinitomicaceae bacterium]